jgi:TRAP-type C4-dicarboxylate transport system permease small subunit
LLSIDQREKMKMAGNKIVRLAGTIANISRNISIACLGITVLLSFVEVIIRKAVGVSIITMNEVGGIGMYLFITFSISYIYHIGGHLSTRLVIDRVPAKPRYMVDTFLHLLTFMFSCLITYLWWKMFLSTFESERYYRLTGIKEWPFHLLGTIAWGMLGVSAAQKFITGIGQYSTKMKGNESLKGNREPQCDE